LLLRKAKIKEDPVTILLLPFLLFLNPHGTQKKTASLSLSIFSISYCLMRFFVTERLNILPCVPFCHPVKDL